MTNFEDEPTPAPADTWLAVCDDLLWGFNHALSNRLAAISSITKIIEYSETGLDPLVSALSEEIATLDRTLGLLRLIPRNPDGTPEPVLLAELLPELLAVHHLRGDMRDLEFEIRAEPDTLPIWVEPARMGHVLLILLGAASRASLAQGSVPILISLGGDEESVVVRIELNAEGGGAGGGESIDAAEANAVTVLLSGSGGELLMREPRPGESRPFGVGLKLPTLLAVRRRETGAGSSW